MIPVLYENSERAFVTNGIGRLSDCISCIVTEERNGIYECEFEYPITGVRYNDIQEGCIVTVTHDDTGDIQPFDIYGRSAPINGIVTFYAHHVSYRLSDIVVGPCTASSPADALDKIRRNSINGNPFTFWTNKTGSGEFKVEAPDYARALLGGQQGSILDVFGKGDYEFDRWTVKLYLNRGTDSGVEIRYGKNLSDIKHDIDISESYNAVVPYWLSSDGDLVMLPEKILIYSGATDRDANLTDEDWQIIRDENGEPIEVTYQIIDAKPLDLSSEFQEAPTVAQLRALAQTKLTESEGWVPDENITVDFVQLWQTEEYADYAPLQRVRLCDAVSVYYPELGVEAVEAKVIKTVYNVLLDRYDSIELGTPQTTLAQAISNAIISDEEIPTIDMMEQAINKATDLITGGLGGYVFLKPNANGKPEEILIMDSDDINQAINVIRMNKNGIGFSSNGYQGPYRSAWTIDGSFVADFITTGTLNAALAHIINIDASNINTGTLNADLITSGKIQSTNGKVYFDLDGNELCADKIVSTDSDSQITFSIGLTRQYGWNESSYYSFRGAVIQQTGVRSSIAFVPGVDNSTINYIRTGIEGLCIASASMQYPGTYQTDSGFLGIVGRKGQLRLYGAQVGGIDRALVDNSYPWGCIAINSKYTANSSSSYTSDGKIEFFGPITAGGINANSLTVSGSKNRVVSTENYGDRLLYCYETPSPLFGDVGEGVIGEDGKCFVWLDAIFAETISTDQYQVFLQRYGDGDCYVAERHPNYFVVSGTEGLSFGWELKAKQSDFDQLRLEKKIEQNYAIDIDSGDLAIEYIQELKQGRLLA